MLMRFAKNNHLYQQLKRSDDATLLHYKLLHRLEIMQRNVMQHLELTQYKIEQMEPDPVDPRALRTLELLHKKHEALQLRQAELEALYKNNVTAFIEGLEQTLLMLKHRQQQARSDRDPSLREITFDVNAKTALLKHLKQDPSQRKTRRTRTTQKQGPHIGKHRKVMPAHVITVDEAHLLRTFLAMNLALHKKQYQYKTMNLIVKLFDRYQDIIQQKGYYLYGTSTHFNIKDDLKQLRSAKKDPEAFAFLFRRMMNTIITSYLHVEHGKSLNVAYQPNRQDIFEQQIQQRLQNSKEIKSIKQDHEAVNLDLGDTTRIDVAILRLLTCYNNPIELDKHRSTIAEILESHRRDLYAKYVGLAAGAPEMSSYNTDVIDLQSLTNRPETFDKRFNQLMIDFCKGYLHVECHLDISKAPNKSQVMQAIRAAQARVMQVAKATEQIRPVIDAHLANYDDAATEALEQVSHARTLLARHHAAQLEAKHAMTELKNTTKRDYARQSYQQAVKLGVELDSQYQRRIRNAIEVLQHDLTRLQELKKTKSNLVEIKRKQIAFEQLLKRSRLYLEKHPSIPRRSSSVHFPTPTPKEKPQQQFYKIMQRLCDIARDAHKIKRHQDQIIKDLVKIKNFVKDQGYFFGDGFESEVMKLYDLESKPAQYTAQLRSLLGNMIKPYMLYQHGIMLRNAHTLSGIQYGKTIFEQDMAAPPERHEFHQSEFELDMLKLLQDYHRPKLNKSQQNDIIARLKAHRRHIITEFYYANNYAHNQCLMCFSRDVAELDHLRSKPELFQQQFVTMMTTIIKSYVGIHAQAPASLIMDLESTFVRQLTDQICAKEDIKPSMARAPRSRSRGANTKVAPTRSEPAVRLFDLSAKHKMRLSQLPSVPCRVDLNSLTNDSRRSRTTRGVRSRSNPLGS